MGLLTIMCVAAPCGKQNVETLMWTLLVRSLVRWLSMWAKPQAERRPVQNLKLPSSPLCRLVKWHTTTFFTDRKRLLWGLQFDPYGFLLDLIFTWYHFCRQWELYVLSLNIPSPITLPFHKNRWTFLFIKTRVWGSLMTSALHLLPKCLDCT